MSAAASGPEGHRAADAGVVVSLVVATRDRLERVEPFVARVVAALDGCPVPAELVLVDNGTSPVPDVLLARVTVDPRVRVVRATLPGLSRARVVGCTAARGTVVVMTDDDVEVDAGWLDRMSAPVLVGDADAVAGRVRLADDAAYPREPLLRRWLAETDDDAPVVAFVGAALAFRRELLGVALWDPALGAGAPGTGFGEDVLFEWMVKEAGARVVRAAGPPVVHRPDVARLTRASWLDAAARRGRSDAYVAHHWLGADVRYLRLRALRHRLRLAAYRRRAPVTGQTPTGAELELVRELNQARALRALRAVPRAYVPR